MEEQEAVVKYFDKILKARGQSSTVLLSALTVLVELLERDEKNSLKKLAIKESLHMTLVGLLQKQCKYSDREHDKASFIPHNDHENGNLDTGSGVLVSRNRKKLSSGVDAILPESEKSALPLIYAVTLRCLHLMCCQSTAYNTMFVDNDLNQTVQTLLQFLCIHPLLSKINGNHFYQFGLKFTSALSDLVRTCEGRVKVISCDAEGNDSEDIFKQLAFYEQELSHTLIKVDQIKSFQVKIPMTGKELDLAEEIMSQDFAWRPCESLPQEKHEPDDESTKLAKVQKKKVTEDMQTNPSWTDARVTCVLRGNFFWMQIGPDALQAAQEISLKLNKMRGKLNKMKSKVGDAVAVQVLTDKGWEVIRARVVFTAGGVSSVFDVDTGQLYKVSIHSIFSLPFEFRLDKISPLATLARLSGVLPTPLDASVVEMAAAILSLMCRYNMAAMRMVVESNILSSLPDLIACPDLEVANQCLSLAAHLLLRRRSRCCSLWQNIVLATLKTLTKCVQKPLQDKAAAESKEDDSGDSGIVSGRSFVEDLSLASPGSDTSPRSVNESGIKMEKEEAGSNESVDFCAKEQSRGGGKSPLTKNRNRALLVSCLLLLNNRLYMSKVTKDLFYQLRGIETVVRAYMLHYKNYQIRTSAVQVLSNFVHTVPLEKLGNDSGTSSGQNNVRQDKTTGAAATTSLTTSSSSPSHLSTLLSPESSPEKRTSVFSKVRKEGDKIYLGVGYEEDSEEEEESSADETCGNDEEDILASCFKARTKTSDLEADESEDMDDIDMKRFYIRGSKVPFTSDSSHELYQNTQLSADSMAAIICGMLNNGQEGKIYLGIEEDSTVKGERLTHNIRDEIRLGMDQIMMSRLVPSILHIQFKISFIPVIHSTIQEGENRLVPYADLFVVEIWCRPVPRVIYCCTNGQCYYRVGTKTMLLQAQDIRHLIVIEEEAWHKDQIQDLQQQVEELKRQERQLMSSSDITELTDSFSSG